jgi:hypothetical protein
MRIQLTYVLADKTRVECTGTWPTTWDSYNWANEQGAVVVIAKVIES